MVANAEEAVKISRETGPAFLGPFALGALALASEDPTARQAALAEGEALLEAGAVSHNHLLFRRDAIDAYLGAGDWEGVERSAAGLAQYTRRSPCRSAIFTVRLRALWHHAAAVSRTQLPSQQSSSISAKGRAARPAGRAACEGDRRDARLIPAAPCNAFKRIAAGYSAAEKTVLIAGTATRFYRLK